MSWLLHLQSKRNAFLVARSNDWCFSFNFSGITEQIQVIESTMHMISAMVKGHRVNSGIRQFGFHGSLTDQYLLGPLFTSTIG